MLIIHNSPKIDVYNIHEKFWLLFKIYIYGYCKLPPAAYIYIGGPLTINTIEMVKVDPDL